MVFGAKPEGLGNLPIDRGRFRQSLVQPQTLSTLGDSWTVDGISRGVEAGWWARILAS